MKVKEVVEKLLKCDQEAELFLHNTYSVGNDEGSSFECDRVSECCSVGYNEGKKKNKAVILSSELSPVSYYNRNEKIKVVE